MRAKKGRVKEQAATVDAMERLIAEAGLDTQSAPLRSLPLDGTTDPGSAVGDGPPRAAYTYFGGKAPVAHLIWQAFGADVDNFIELFAGSAAVLLARPPADDTSKERIETLNDADGFIVNTLRAIKADPEGLAAGCDYPPTEIDLVARHHALKQARAALTSKLFDDAEYYDLKLAGWWLWGTRSWVASGWCSPQLKAMSKLPRARTPGWQGGSALAHLSALSRRLSRVRITCRDWATVAVSYTTTESLGVTGIFLDPPYSLALRPELYAHDDPKVAEKACKWALDPERYDNPNFRIALCGYESEHEDHIPNTWRRIYWRTVGGYGNRSHGRGRDNAGQETIWLSPHCHLATGSVSKDQKKQITYVPDIDLSK